MNYPLTITFKLLAIARQLAVRDAQGALIFYVKQRAFKIKESITVFADAEQRQPVYQMNANRVLDISARYDVTDETGAKIGAVERRGMRSLWRAHYDITDADGRTIMSISEEKPWTKVLDGLLGQVPVLGLFAGYLFHPAYLVTRANNDVVLRLEKQPALFEGKFQVTRHATLDADEERLAILSLVMMVLLERGRG